MVGEQPLLDLGWNVRGPPEDPEPIPDEHIFPVDKSLSHLLVDVHDCEGFRERLPTVTRTKRE